VLCAVCCVLCAVCCVLCAVCCVLCAVCCVLCDALWLTCSPCRQQAAAAVEQPTTQDGTAAAERRSKMARVVETGCCCAEISRFLLWRVSDHRLVCYVAGALLLIVQPTWAILDCVCLTLFPLFGKIRHFCRKPLTSMSIRSAARRSQRRPGRACEGDRPLESCCCSCCFRLSAFPVCVHFFGCRRFVCALLWKSVERAFWSQSREYPLHRRSSRMRCAFLWTSLPTSAVDCSAHFFCHNFLCALSSVEHHSFVPFASVLPIIERCLNQQRLFFAASSAQRSDSQFPFRRERPAAAMRLPDGAQYRPRSGLRLNLRCLCVCCVLCVVCCLSCVCVCCFAAQHSTTALHSTSTSSGSMCVYVCSFPAPLSVTTHHHLLPPPPTAAATATTTTSRWAATTPRALSRSSPPEPGFLLARPKAGVCVFV
jgi:hypothetical protein